MRKEDFREWLEERISRRAASDCLSRCKKTEVVLNVDLDDEYSKDCGKSVIESLSYGKKEADAGISSSSSFSFNSDNLPQRFTDLRSAVKKYFKFCGEEK